MRNTIKGTAAILGATFTICTSIGLAALNQPGPAGLAPEQAALTSLSGQWGGQTNSYLWQGIPPTKAPSTTQAFMVADQWVSVHLQTEHLSKPYSEVIMLGFDGEQVTGSIFNSSDASTRPLTGTFDVASITWTLLHDSLNSAGVVLPTRTVIQYDQRSKERTLTRHHLMPNGDEALALENLSTRRGR